MSLSFPLSLVLLLACSAGVYSGCVRVEGPGVHITNSSKAVIFIHGLFNDPDEPDFASRYIPQVLGSEYVLYKISLYDGDWSIWNIKTQLKDFIPAMQQIMDKHKDSGVALLCYSQGGFICRSALELMDDHNVHTLITLGSPLAGQYGVTSVIAPYVPNRDRSILYKFFYTRAGQWISFADYWNDPHHQAEFSNNKTDVLLARLNNQTDNPSSQRYKSNFSRLQCLSLVGGPNDTIITPWQSSQFAFYNNEDVVLPMEHQSWYEKDSFGLKTLDKLQKIHRLTIPGVTHFDWVKTQLVFDKGVIPYLRNWGKCI